MVNKTPDSSTQSTPATKIPFDPTKGLSAFKVTSPPKDTEDTIPTPSTTQTPAVPQKSESPSPQKKKNSYIQHIAPLTLKQLDMLSNLAKKIQRSRTPRKPRITENSIIRSMLDVLLTLPLETDEIKNEQELTEHIKKAVYRT